MSVLLTSVEDIRDSAVDAIHCDLATLLRKCRVVAAQLRNKPLEDWIRFESDGYPKEVSVPDYRVTVLHMKGNFSIPGGIMRDAPIPPSNLPVHLCEKIQKCPLRASVALLEEQVKNAKKGMVIFNMNALAPKLQIYQNANCIEAWGEISISVHHEILNAVRNRVLEFSLMLQQEATADGDVLSPDSSAGKEKVTQMVQANIYGGNNVIVGGANNTVAVSQITAEDFNSLSDVFANNGILADDIADLRAALTADRKATNEKFGPKTQKWIDEMINKAKDGFWDISVKAANSLLTESLKRYLGL